MDTRALLEQLNNNGSDFQDLLALFKNSMNHNGPNSANDLIRELLGQADNNDVNAFLESSKMYEVNPALREDNFQVRQMLQQALNRK